MKEAIIIKITNILKDVDGNETSQSEWSEEDDGGASEPLLDRESTGGYTTDDAALEHASVMNDAGLTDAEGNYIYLFIY